MVAQGIGRGGGNVGSAESPLHGLHGGNCRDLFPSFPSKHQGKSTAHFCWASSVCMLLRALPVLQRVHPMWVTEINLHLTCIPDFSERKKGAGATKSRETDLYA